MSKIKVVLIDDHNLVRYGIKATLESFDTLEVIGEGANGVEAIEIVKKLKPDVLVMDISMPEMTGLEAIKKMRDEGMDVKTLMLSMHDNHDYVLGSIESGANGYLLKDAENTEFVKAIETVASGNNYYSSAISDVLAKGYLKKIQNGGNADDNGLTKKEILVLKEIVQGKNNRQIADGFSKSIRTIEAHRFNIMKKLDVKNAAELVKVAIEQKLV